MLFEIKALIMIKSILTAVSLLILFLTGCSKDEEISTIFLTEYDLEGLYFKDTSIVYNINGDQHDDFSLEISWGFDTIDNPWGYSADEHITVRLVHLWDIACGWSEYNYIKHRQWEPGDTVYESDRLNWTGMKSGSSGWSVARKDSFDNYMSKKKNEDVYWGYYLESGGKIHYGWIRQRCDLFAEVAYNITPEEPIVIGQRH